MAETIKVAMRFRGNEKGEEKRADWKFVSEDTLKGEDDKPMTYDIGKYEVFM